ASTAPVTLTPIADAIVEGIETVTLTVQANVNYAVGSPNNATVSIQDASVITIVATDASASEVGPNTGTFTVTRTGGDQSGALTVFFNTPTGSASSGTDYTALPASVTIPAGASTAPVTFTPILDASVEGTETVILTVQSLKGSVPE